MMERARAAQQIFATSNQQQVDACVRAVGKVVYDNAQELAADAVAETGMGNLTDKTLKNQGKSRNVWNYLKGKKSVGIIEPKDAEGMISR